MSDHPATRPEISSLNEKFMRRAIALSTQGIEAGDGGPFGAVVVKDGIIVGEGWNRVIATNDPTAHGEIVAIRDACSRLNTFELADCDIYTTGEPCPMCLTAIYWARMRRIFFGFTIEDAERIGFDDNCFYREINKSRQDRSIQSIQLLKDESMQVARRYMQMPDRTLY
ncbi:nucleoside deaminase [Geoalkalibacter subterraneus]|nr:nucleoside deaminase [Geoalkalibacter subterraneus]